MSAPCSWCLVARQLASALLAATAGYLVLHRSLQTSHSTGLQVAAAGGGTAAERPEGVEAAAAHEMIEFGDVAHAPPKVTLKRRRWDEAHVAAAHRKRHERALRAHLDAAEARLARDGAVGGGAPAAARQEVRHGGLRQHCNAHAGSVCKLQLSATEPPASPVWWRTQLPG
jgi:hypothetical protein